MSAESFDDQLKRVRELLAEMQAKLDGAKVGGESCCVDVWVEQDVADALAEVLRRWDALQAALTAWPALGAELRLLGRLGGGDQGYTVHNCVSQGMVNEELDRSLAESSELVHFKLVGTRADGVEIWRGLSIRKHDGAFYHTEGVCEHKDGHCAWSIFGSDEDAEAYAQRCLTPPATSKPTYGDEYLGTTDSATLTEKPRDAEE